MNVDSILISDYATLTDNDQSLTVVRVFNALSAKDFPATKQWMAISLIVHAHRDERGSEHDLEIRVVHATRKPDTVIHRGKFRLAQGEPPPGVPLRQIVIHQMVQVAFPDPGAYAFEVYIDGTYHASSVIHLGQAE
ncbi:MAG: hypothetical protein Q8N53_14355 [Longimicrobiales bacterium]|nr:hypothetical protein [Longimicrobiales bacterium]